MALDLINQLGEWNPQLFRELKGQFRPRNVIFVVVGSLLGQLLLVLGFYHQNYSESGIVTSWWIEWMALFQILSWLMPLALLVSGVHLIVGDLAKEEHRGTFNFIRLTPQPSQSILLGKVLGVPALLYLGVGLAIPLHWISGLAAGLPFSWIIALEIFWVSICGLFYSAALLWTLLGTGQRQSKVPAGAGSLLALMVGTPCISITTIFYADPWKYGVGDWHWFYLPGNQALLPYGLTLLTFSWATYWFWQAANRRFRNPNVTLLSKQQSYWLVATWQLWMLGFVLPVSNSFSSESLFILGLCILFALNPIGFLMLITTLSPPPQVMKEWARYGHFNHRTKKLATRKRPLSNFSSLWNSSAVQDLIWGERSPALLAIAINLSLTALIWIPWIWLGFPKTWSGEINGIQVALGLFMTMNVLLIFAAITEIMAFAKIYLRAFLAAGTLAAIFLPPLVLIALSLTPDKAPGLWFFSVVPALALPNASATTIFLGFLGQLSILGLFTFQLTRQLRKAGETTSKELFLTSQKK